ncbi:MAG: Tryptophan synthase alpha chain, partial [Deltaproteobacteria bacterium]|nr:Tryptophan synthase alpha chain [Deltaproteobacteria bacterium]
SAQPAPKPNINAPPQGTITFITSSTPNINASGVLPGTYQYVQWTCNGTRSNEVDVVLFQNNSPVLTIGTSATGKIAYWVPKNLIAGNYEYRVTNKADPRIQARKPVLISAKITVTNPVQNEVLNMESYYEAAWSYVGNPGPVAVTYKNENGCEKTIAATGSASSPIVMANGVGKVTWKAMPIDDCFSSNPKTNKYRVFVKTTGTPQIAASSGLFSIPCKYEICGQTQMCINTKGNDASNCGACGYACMAHGHYGGCLNGKCLCEANQTDCPGKGCTILKIDPQNCGACGNKCVDPSPDCDNGRCICRGPNHMVCPYYGKISCIDVTINSENCGKCGNKCPQDKRYCRNGVCQP